YGRGRWFESSRAYDFADVAQPEEHRASTPERPVRSGSSAPQADARAKPTRPCWSAPPSRRLRRTRGQSPRVLAGRRRRVGALGGRAGKAHASLLVGAAESAPYRPVV